MQSIIFLCPPPLSLLMTLTYGLKNQWASSCQHGQLVRKVWSKYTQQLALYYGHKIIFIITYYDFDLWPWKLVWSKNTSLCYQGYFKILILSFDIWHTKSIRVILSSWLMCLSSLMKMHIISSLFVHKVKVELWQMDRHMYPWTDWKKHITVYANYFYDTSDIFSNSIITYREPFIGPS